ncbi:hypothetical protein BaRGS_00001427 [Batillaria attramentaria]|uniref:Uncharacterized protein n=1 Tax=Batillaria attramentaria TaxID=370345 RepID=A0ABD0M805_9CAEN
MAYDSITKIEARVRLTWTILTSEQRKLFTVWRNVRSDLQFARTPARQISPAKCKSLMTANMEAAPVDGQLYSTVAMFHVQYVTASQHHLLFRKLRHRQRPSSEEAEDPRDDIHRLGSSSVHAAYKIQNRWHLISLFSAQSLAVETRIDSKG